MLAGAVGDGAAAEYPVATSDRARSAGRAPARQSLGRAAGPPGRARVRAGCGARLHVRDATVAGGAQSSRSNAVRPHRGLLQADLPHRAAAASRRYALLPSRRPRLPRRGLRRARALGARPASLRVDPGRDPPRRRRDRLQRAPARRARSRQGSRPTGSPIPPGPCSSRCLAGGAQARRSSSRGASRRRKGSRRCSTPSPAHGPPFPGRGSSWSGTDRSHPTLGVLSRRYGIDDAVDVIGWCDHAQLDAPDGRGLGRRRPVRLGRAVRARRARRDRARRPRDRIGRRRAARDRRGRGERDCSFRAARRSRSPLPSSPSAGVTRSRQAPSRRRAQRGSRPRTMSTGTSTRAASPSGGSSMRARGEIVVPTRDRPGQLRSCLDALTRVPGRRPRDPRRRRWQHPTLRDRGALPRRWVRS